jgi:anti-sigma factor RsiW
LIYRFARNDKSTLSRAKGLSSMLLDRYRQLLTAYVDGELSSRQRRYVVRLLHRSAEARQLLQQLKADARTLRQLPRPSLPADLTGAVLRLISERNLAPRQSRTIQVVPAMTWMGPLTSWTVAATVLLSLGVASYFYFAASLDQAAKTEIVQKQPEPTISTPHPEEPGLSIAHKEDGISTEPRKSAAPKINPPSAVKTPRMVRQRGERSKPNSVDKPPSPPKEETALTDRLETFHFDCVPDLLPVVVKLGGLDRLPARKKLAAELSKDNAFRLELPCSNGTKAFDRVQKAARTLHIGFIIDKAAQERIKLKWNVSYLLYLEDVMPEELTGFVRQIDAEDRKSEAGKPAEAQFDRLVLMRMSAGHRKELTTLLGVDPITTAPSATGSLADPHKPLTDATARLVQQSLAGQGGAPRAEPGKSAAQAPDHIALVLAYNHVHPSPGSDEIKHFLENRKPIRAGALRVLLVLRGG